MFVWRALLVWFHDVVWVSEWPWSAVVASCATQRAKLQSKPYADAMFAAYQVFDKLVGFLIQDITIACGFGVKSVCDLTICFDPRGQSSGSCENLNEEICIDPCRFNGIGFAHFRLVRFGPFRRAFVEHGASWTVIFSSLC